MDPEVKRQLDHRTSFIVLTNADATIRFGSLLNEKEHYSTLDEVIIDDPLPVNVIEMPRIRWQLSIMLHDVGRRCKFPFTTKAKAFAAANGFDARYSKVERLDREPDQATIKAWTPYLDMSVEDIILQCEEIRNGARPSSKSKD